MKFIFHPKLQQDVSNSYQWYEDRAKGLGEDLLSEIKDGYSFINEFPESCPIVQKNYHRFILSKFPFSIVYRINKNNIYVVAIMHNSRRPNSWLIRK